MTRDEVIDHLGLSLNPVPNHSSNPWVLTRQRQPADRSVWCWFLLCVYRGDKVTVRTRAAGEKPENGVFWNRLAKVNIPLPTSPKKIVVRNHPASA